MDTRAEKDSEREKQFVLFQAIAFFFLLSFSEPVQSLSKPSFQQKQQFRTLSASLFPMNSLSLLTCLLLSVSDSINLPQAKAVIFPSSFSEMS
jgi:hypothetical protein